MNNLKKVARIALPLAMVALPLMTFALPDPTTPVSGNAISLSEIQSIIERIARFLIIISIVVAVGFIVWGAIVWMSAGGNDDRASQGKKFIWNGIIGAAVVFAVGVILQTTAALVARTFFG